MRLPANIGTRASAQQESLHLYSRPARSRASSATVEGITSDGNNIWIVDSKADKLFYYATATSRSSGTQTAPESLTLAAGNTNPKDLL